MVDEALGGERCSYSVVDQPDDLENPVAVGVAHLDTIADTNRTGRLGGGAIDLNVCPPLHAAAESDVSV